MITFLAIGDPHYKTHNFNDTNTMESQIYVILNSKLFDFIVVLGDVLDRHENIHINPLNRAVKFLLKLSEYAPTYVLIGNHDRPNNNDFLSDFSPFIGLKGHKNLYIVDKVLHDNIHGKDFIFVPYVPPGRFIEALQTIDFEYQNADIIFAHQEFRGAKSSSHVSEHGDVWSETYPNVISGHYHDYHRIQENLIYVGTPFQHSFGENTDKSISIFKYDTELHEERIRLDMPKKITFKCTLDEFNKLNVEDINSNVKIIVSCHDFEIETLKNNNIYKHLSRKGIRIEIRKVEHHIGIKYVDNTTINFIDLLTSKLNGNDKLLQIFNKILSILNGQNIGQN